MHPQHLLARHADPFVQAARPGREVELRRGPYVIVARVVWAEGPRVGLECDERLPVDAIMSLGLGEQIEPSFVAGHKVERRRVRRPTAETSREQGRTLQFVAAAAVGAVLAAGVSSMVLKALARPLAMVATALDGPQT